MNTIEESREFVGYGPDGIRLTPEANRLLSAQDRVKAALIGYHLWAEQRGFGPLDLLVQDICIATALTPAQVKSPLCRLRQLGLIGGEFGKYYILPEKVAVQAWRLRRKLLNEKALRVHQQV